MLRNRVGGGREQKKVDSVNGSVTNRTINREV